MLGERDGVLGVADEVLLGGQTDRVLGFVEGEQSGRCAIARLVHYDRDLLVAVVGDGHRAAAEINAHVYAGHLVFEWFLL